MLVVDARLERAIDGVEEIVAVILDVETEQIVAEQAVQDVLLPRADAERLAVRPRDVPELADRDVGPRLLHESRQQREVIVLHEHDGAVVADFFDHRIGEAAIHPHVLMPVRIVELRARIGDVAERPQRVVGAAVVVALLFFRREPHAPQRVRRAIGRHAQAAARIGGFAIGAAAAVRDPGAAARAHHRIERGHEAARRPRPLDAFGFLPAADPVPQSARGPPAAHVDVRLAVGDDDQSRAAQRIGERRFQLSRSHHDHLTLLSRRQPSQETIDVDNTVELVCGRGRAQADEHADAYGNRAERIFIRNVIADVGHPGAARCNFVSTSAVIHFVASPLWPLMFGRYSTTALPSRRRT